MGDRSMISRMRLVVFRHGRDQRFIGKGRRDDIEDLGLECVRAGTDLDGASQVIGVVVGRWTRRPQRRIGRDVHLLALGHQGVARQRVGVLAADQRADPPDLGRGDAQSARVAVGPDELFVERRHELAVVVENAAVGADQQVRIPQAADAGVRAFADADRDMDAMLARRRGKPRHLLAVATHGLHGEGAEEIVILDRRAQRRPYRKAGHETLRERDQRRALGGGLADERYAFSTVRGAIEKHRRDMAGSGFEAWVTQRHTTVPD